MEYIICRKLKSYWGGGVWRYLCITVVNSKDSYEFIEDKSNATIFLDERTAYSRLSSIGVNCGNGLVNFILPSDDDFEYKVEALPPTEYTHHKLTLELKAPVFIPKILHNGSGILRVVLLNSSNIDEIDIGEIRINYLVTHPAYVIMIWTATEPIYLPTCSSLEEAKTMFLTKWREYILEKYQTSSIFQYFNVVTQ